MKKKLFTLLTLALLGMSSAWAEDAISCSSYLSSTSGAPTTTNCTFKYFSDEGSAGSVPSGTKITVSSTDYYYAKMNNDKNYYEVTLAQTIGTTTYSTFQAGDAITVYLYSNGATVAYKVGKVQTEVSKEKQTKSTIISVPHTLTATEIESDGTLRIYRNSSNTYFAGISVTGTRSTETFTVTFNAGSNGTCATSSLTEGSAGAGVTLPAVTPKSGYIFNGWYTAASGGTKVGDASSTYKPTANITLYAQYTAETAPTISVDNTTPSTNRGTAITLTATVTGAPTPTVTWYQSETATNSGGSEVGTGNTYSPNVSAEGTFYFYAVASNGIGTDATSSLVTLTVTNPDLTISGNNFYIAVGDLAIPEQNIICDDITMQYSTGDFSAATKDETVKALVSGFVASVNCSTNGWGVTFTPSKPGLLKVGVVINNDKTFTITNVTGFSYETKSSDSSGTIEANTWKPSEKKYAVITIAVQAGTDYKFSVSGSKMGFYGFEFTPATATTVNLNASGYATLSAYYPVEISGAKAYTATLDFENSTITCTEIAGGQVPAGAGVLLYGDANATVTLNPIATAAALGSNNLMGTTQANGLTVTKGSNNYYVLSGDTFKKFTGDTFGANKAYFEVAAGGARALKIVFDDEATGIKAMNIEHSTLNIEHYYDLQGRRVAQPTKGLYIVNGKKVIK